MNNIFQSYSKTIYYLLISSFLLAIAGNTAHYHKVSFALYYAEQIDSKHDHSHHSHVYENHTFDCPFLTIFNSIHTFYDYGSNFSLSLIAESFLFIDDLQIHALSVNKTPDAQRAPPTLS